MDVQTSNRVTRARAKSTSEKENAEETNAPEMAPNVDEKKNGETKPAPESEEPVVDEKLDTKDESEPKESRKRKLSEVVTEKETKIASPSKVEKSKDEESKDDKKPEEVQKDAEVKMETEAEVSTKQTPTVQDKTEPKVKTIITAAAEPTTPVSSHTATPKTVSSASAAIQDELNLLNISTESYGKGKRARIPNKRYNDIIPVRTPKQESTRGTKSQTSTPVSTKNGEFSSKSAPSKAVQELQEEDEEGNLSSSDKGTKKGRTTDISDPKYLKPFDYGWRRELVFRSTGTEGKSVSDVYYYSPEGVKLRSMREIAANLPRNLKIENFTYYKQALGVDDPSKETIRNARIGGTQVVTKPEMKGKKRSMPVSSPSSAKSKTFKVKVPKPNSAVKKEKKEPEPEPESNGSQIVRRGRSNLEISPNKPCRPCSIRCEGVLGLVPTLQCRICLCLYHNECVGIPSQVTVQGYVCKNCQLEKEPTVGVSGTNISSLTSPESSKAPPILKPVTPDVKNHKTSKPKTGSTVDTDPAPQVGNLVAATKSNTAAEVKSLVGSLTTWFPPSSTIQTSDMSAEELANVPSRPQMVEYIGDKKYIVILRHNVLSVKSPHPAPSEPVRPSEPICTNEPVCPSEPVATATVPTNNESIISAPVDDISTENSVPASEVAPADIPAEGSKVEAAECEQPSDETVERVSEGPKSPTKTTQKVVDLPTVNFFQSAQYGYTTLYYVFQYLKVQDLLRAGQVCTMWRDVSRSSILWRTVRMKNSQIHSFEGMANALHERGTLHLDLRKMLLPANATNDDIWPSFTEAIKKVQSLKRIELCRCLASVVEDLARNNHNLEVINAVTIKCESMTFEPFANLANLVDLRLKSTAGLTLSSDLTALKGLTNLKHLSITSIKDLSKLKIEVIGELENLEVLDLGQCIDFPKTFGPEVLGRLTKLEKLRLEMGQGECHTFDILAAVRDLPQLHQLELVNFDIRSGFDKALGACLNIKKLLIIPTYISQSAITNHMVLAGVLRLQKTLQHFVWGLTLELLRVTELFVDQCEMKSTLGKSEIVGGCIPVLKPVPLIELVETEANDSEPQIEILPLSNLQKLLLQNLPTTRVKILKIPFHATWRQSITDSVN